MSNYVLQIDLGDGFAKADKALDSLLKKVGSLSSSEVDFSLDKAIDDSGILGEKIGEKVGGGMNKKLSSLNIFDGWGKAVAKGISDSAIKGLKDVGGKDVAKVLGLGDISEIGKGTIKGLRDVGGKDLAKVQAMGDITQFDKKFDKRAFIRELLVGGIATLFNPFVGSGMLAGSIGKHKGEGNETLGALSALTYGETFVIVKSLESVVKVFGAAVRTFYDAAGKADKFYSAALQSGLGLKFTIQRGTLAQIMGVSEKDVFRFGAQMAYLNPKIEDAVKILSDTTKPLTQVSWETKVLFLDLSALAAKLSVEVAPAIMGFIDALDVLVKYLTKHSEIPTATLAGAFPGLSLLGFAGKGLNKAMGGKDSKSGGIPDPQGWMKQLPDSSWEKMGLVTMGGGGNYAKETARNTKETAAMLKVLVQRAGVSKGQNSNWGMSPNVSQP